MNSILYFPFITMIERKEKIKEIQEKNLKSKDNINKDNMNKKNDISPSMIDSNDNKVLIDKDKYKNLVCLSNLEDVVILPEKDYSKLSRPRLSFLTDNKRADFFDKFHDCFEP